MNVLDLLGILIASLAVLISCVTAWNAGRSAAAAIRSAKNTEKSARAATLSAETAAKALQEAAERAVQQSRPMVVAELRRHMTIDNEPSEGVQDLVIKNYGATPARGLTIRFDPEIPDPLAGQEIKPGVGALTASLVRRLTSRPIDVLSPGAELVQIYMVGEPGLDGTRVNTEPTPDRFAVDLTYEDMGGREFTDGFNLDVHDVGYSSFSRKNRRRG